MSTCCLEHPVQRGGPQSVTPSTIPLGALRAHARGVASLVLAPLQAGRQESQLIGQELALFVSFGPCQLAGMPERCKKFTGYIEP